MSRCNYCAFFSRACSAPDWGAYADSIILEIDYWCDKLGPIDVPTIFFGGGTPSLMPVEIFAKIINRIATQFHILPDAEITIESNPGTLDAGRLHDFVATGVNRLSIGVQSLDNARLTFMGRRHSADDARELLRAATDIGLRVSGDFIYGLPGDTADSVAKMCDAINDLNLRHVSMYELTIEANTPFGKMNLDMPSNAAMAEMYDAIDRKLNLTRYEVSNYAATNTDQCVHNVHIWDGAPYIGIGRGAAGRIFIDGTWYEQLGNNEMFSPLTDNQRGTEMILTGMRTVRGAQINDLTRPLINTDFIHANPDLLNIINGTRITATKKGMLILDDLLLNLVR